MIAVRPKQRCVRSGEKRLDQLRPEAAATGIRIDHEFCLALGDERGGNLVNRDEFAGARAVVDEGLV
jgi:hypothetical protein